MPSTLNVPPLQVDLPPLKYGNSEIEEEAITPSAIPSKDEAGKVLPLIRIARNFLQNGNTWQAQF